MAIEDIAARIFIYTDWSWSGIYILPKVKSRKSDRWNRSHLFDSVAASWLTHRNWRHIRRRVHNI